MPVSNIWSKRSLDWTETRRCWSLQLVFLFCQLTGSSGQERPMELNGVLGESVIFPLGIPEGTIKTVNNIVWSAKTTLATWKPEAPDKLEVLNRRYRNRLHVQGSYSLNISDLNKEDSGTYRAEINREGSDPTIKTFTLRVYKRLSELDIEISNEQGLAEKVNGTCNTTLKCSVKAWGENVTYSWTRVNSSDVYNGESFPILHERGEEYSSYTCTAKNPVSQSSKTVSSQAFCEADSSFPSGHQSGKVAGVSVFLLLLLVVGVGATFFWCWARKKKDTQRLNQVCADSKLINSTVYAEVGPTHGAQGSKQIELKKKSDTKEESSTTIYSKVEHPIQSHLQTDDEKLMEEKKAKTIYSTIQAPTKMDCSTSTNVYETTQHLEEEDAGEKSLKNSSSMTT
uniref:Ig-like domain-containing protein n=2 Tax=Sphenodon punctatus TaxID=8508 RepID=A0A8D0GTZ1_SPHPU